MAEERIIELENRSTETFHTIKKIENRMKEQEEEEEEKERKEKEQKPEQTILVL